MDARASSHAGQTKDVSRRVTVAVDGHGSASSSIRDLFGSLRMPMIAAPMTMVSTPEWVAAACAAGVIGAFPTSNAPSVDALDDWLAGVALRASELADPQVAVGPIVANLIVGKQNARLERDIECVVRHRVPFAITSVGNPATYIPALQAGGTRVFVDVASMHHAERALAAGADGLVLLGAGAGGHTGWANPFAFARAVRRMFAGPLIIAGGIADGAALWAAITLGFDAGMVGTRLIATPESGAGDNWRAALVAASMDDVIVEPAAHNGVAASLLRDGGGSCGHTVSCVLGIVPVREVVTEMHHEYLAARDRTRGLLSSQ
jgi:nitronate monooxygenase